LERAVQAGVQVFEKSEVLQIDSGDATTLHTKSSQVRCRFALVGTHYPFQKPQPLPLFFKKAKYISYVCEVHLPIGTLREGLYEDTEQPFHYMRVDRMQGFDRLLLGGEDHRADIPVESSKNERALEHYLRRRLGAIPYTIVQHWKGPIIETTDGLAYIGPLDTAPSVYYATGYSGNGMTYAAIAAHIFSDAVQQRHNPYAALYATNRKVHLIPHLVKAKEYIETFFGGAVRNTLFD
jgi:glycine/D-amino acid oxidase-like deaminating enzyme